MTDGAGTGQPSPEQDRAESDRMTAALAQMEAEARPVWDRLVNRDEARADRLDVALAQMEEEGRPAWEWLLNHAEKDEERAVSGHHRGEADDLRAALDDTRAALADARVEIEQLRAETAQQHTAPAGPQAVQQQRRSLFGRLAARGGRHRATHR